jgi:MFS family permease
VIAPREQAKRRFYAFTFFNVISFSFIGIDIMTLYSLRLGASSVFLGMLSSFFFMTFFFTLIGRKVVRRMGAVRTFGTFWLIRYLLMLPVALTALPFLREQRGLVFAIIALGVFGFNVSKGVAIAAHPPVLGGITGDRDRGSFLARNQLIIHLMRIVTGISMALLLGQNSPLATYAFFILTGIFAGLVASQSVFRLPEPKSVAGEDQTNLLDAAKRAWRSSQFRTLAASTGLATFVISMATPFLVVFFKDLYGHLDSSIVLFTVAGSVGAVAMALISGFLIDRVGSKPLMFTFTGIAVAVFVSVLFQPGVDGGIAAVVFPIIVYFLFQMGHFGMLNAADTYFFSSTTPSDRLDFGILFGLMKGIAGFFGGFAGGFYLSVLQRLIPDSPARVFQFFFLGVVLALIVIFVLVRRLPDAGAIPLQDAISILFSPRDLRAIRLLNRLDKTKTHHDEARTVEALGATGSRVPVSELIAKVQSPSIFVRMGALEALRNTVVGPEIENLLLSEVKNHTFTTAHIAADILGDRQIRSAIPILRECLDSEDYMLVAKSMIALARLGDRESLPRIRRDLERSRNPRVVIYAAKAVDILRDPDSLDLLLARLERKSYPFLRDEILLSIAGLLGFSDWFYPLYGRFLAGSAEAVSDLREFLFQAGRSELAEVVNAVPRTPGEFALLASAAIAESEPSVGGHRVDDRLVAALSKRSICRLERFRFLIAARIVWGVVGYPDQP